MRDSALLHILARTIRLIKEGSGCAEEEGLPDKTKGVLARVPNLDFSQAFSDCNVFTCIDRGEYCNRLPSWGAPCCAPTIACGYANYFRSEADLAPPANLL
jgi:hypothetical protein